MDRGNEGSITITKISVGHALIGACLPGNHFKYIFLSSLLVTYSVPLLLLLTATKSTTKTRQGTDQRREHGQDEDKAKTRMRWRVAGERMFRTKARPEVKGRA